MPHKTALALALLAGLATPLNGQTQVGLTPFGGGYVPVNSQPVQQSRGIRGR